MANHALAQTQKLDLLVNNLLATLEEAKFFNLMGKFIADELSVEKFKAFRVMGDNNAKLIADNGVEIVSEEIYKQGACIHVIKTKRPYFSNTIERDPVFSQDEKNGIRNELIMPIIQDGVLIATLHLQNLKDGSVFGKEHINSVVDYLKIIERPLNNLKLYISAKALNEVLLKKIEEKESALKIKSDESSISFKSGNTKEHLLIGKSSLFLNVLKIAEKSAQTDVNVLLLGEAGTGKTSIAKIIHCRSSRKSSVCNEFDCSTYADSRVFEQELFGSKGSEFINGRNDREGALESANGGTLILKRIEHLSVSLQAKLLSFLKDGTAQRLGDHRNYRVNVRIIATTNVDLKKRVDEGMFREDLFYTLGTIAIEVPALRQRQDDIEIMAYHFLNNGKDASLHKTLALGVVKALARHNWQGNIRELQNIMERAYILADGAIVDEAHISDYVMAGPKIETKLEKKENIYSPVTLEALEKRHICDTLEHLGGNKTKSAKMLGITVKTLYNKLHSYGMITAISPDA